jgi:hypothetical protein
VEVTRPFETMARGGRERARLLRARDARILKVCPNALERNTLDDAVVLWNRWKRPGCGSSFSKWSASGSSFEAKCYKKAGELRRRRMAGGVLRLRYFKVSTDFYFRPSNCNTGTKFYN